MVQCMNLDEDKTSKDKVAHVIYGINNASAMHCKCKERGGH